MMNKILSLLAQADVVLLANQVTVTTARLTGEPANQVVRLSWPDGEDGDSGDYSAILTEAGLQGAKFDETSQSFKIEDVDGDELTLTLVSNGNPMTPEDAIVYVLLQEGGSSSELYIHAHESREDAEDDRVRCEDNGAYRTSEIIEVPASLANHPSFYSIAEQLVALTATLGFPEDV